MANICFDKAYQKAIEDKPIEEQRAEQKLYEWPQAQRQAEIVAATAKLYKLAQSARRPNAGAFCRGRYAEGGSS